MKYPIVVFLLLICDAAYARPPHPADDVMDRELAEQPFLREYGMGVLRGLFKAIGGLLAGVVGLLKGVLTGLGSLLRRLV